MDHVANVNADSDLDLTFRGSVGIAFGQSALNCHGALSRFQCALELDQESVPDRFDLDAVELRKDFPKQPAMLLQHFLGKLVVALAQRAVADHVGEHDRGQLALFLGAHFLAFPNSRPGAAAWATAQLRRLSLAERLRGFTSVCLRRVSGSADHCGADRTSDRAGAAQEAAEYFRPAGQGMVSRAVSVKRPWRDRGLL